MRQASAGGRPARIMLVGLAGRFGLLALLDDDAVAERLELALQAPSAVLGRVAAALPVGSEFAERDLVADDVVVGDEDVVAGCADCFGLTAPSAQLEPSWDVPIDVKGGCG